MSLAGNGSLSPCFPAENGARKTLQIAEKGGEHRGLTNDAT
jgi:hypothetical protein